MTKAALEAVIGKALLENEFRQALLADPERVLAEFDMTEGEKASLKRMDSETMERLAETLRARPVKKRSPA